MHELDETDTEILRLLGEDARRPFSDIAKAVGLSGPAVSDRVARLQEVGIINRFTVDVDRTQLHAGVPIFVRVVDVSDVDELKDRVGGADAVEQVFVTAEGDVWFAGRTRVRNVRQWIESLIADDEVNYSVTLLDEINWQPSLDGTEFALACAECDNTVDSEGTSSRIDGEVYHFCCTSCQTRFEDRYAQFEEAAE